MGFRDHPLIYKLSKKPPPSTQATGTDPLWGLRGRGPLPVGAREALGAFLGGEHPVLVEQVSHVMRAKFSPSTDGLLETKSLKPQRSLAGKDFFRGGRRLYREDSQGGTRLAPGAQD